MSGGQEAPLAPPRLRPARLDDYPQIERLEAAHGLLTLPADDWLRFWHENPLRPRLGDAWPIGWVLEDDAGRVVGSLANVPSLYTFRGHELLAATGRAWVAAPEYRGIALWLMDEYFNQEGVDLFINTTVNALAVDPFSAFGSSRVPLGDWETAGFWVTAHRGFASAALRIKGVPLPGLLGHPAGALLGLKDAFTVRTPPVMVSADVAATTTFDARFDAFWDELVQQSPNRLLALRDRRTLAWHFAGPLRAGHACILTASRGGLLRAYAVLKRQDHPPSGLRRLRLVDYQTVDPAHDLLPNLLPAALARCAAEGVHVLEHVGVALPKMRAFEAFAPYRRSLPAWPFYYKAADETLEIALRDPAVWDPSTFDGDASL